MGRLVDFLAGVVALARLLVEARGVWRESRRDAGSSGPEADGDRERPDQSEPDDE